MSILEKKIDVSNEELTVRRALLEIGVPDHLRGYSYLIAAIEMTVKDPDAVHGIAKKVYAEIARKYEVTAVRVEKSIRNAIETAWTRTDLEVLRKYFGGTVDPMRGRPTVREFISRVANIIRTGV